MHAIVVGMVIDTAGTISILEIRFLWSACDCCAIGIICLAIDTIIMMSIIKIVVGTLMITVGVPINSEGAIHIWEIMRMIMVSVVMSVVILSTASVLNIVVCIVTNTA